ncbi:MAG: hypothetical protein JST84_19560 [Acidobacteria bacterium]|nr:hypothetical protein [Acidobacteriota bacterium]
MKRFFDATRIALVFTLIFTLSLAGFSHDTAKPGISTLSAVTADSVALLPSSDAVAVVDVARLVNELLPQFRAIAPGQAVKFEQEISEFINETGIDPYKIKSAVIGVKMSDSNSVSAIIEGITFDPNRLITAIKGKDNKQEVKTLDYKGKQIFVVTSTKAAKARGNEEMAFTQLDADRVALGNLTGVKTALDGGNGASNTALNTLLAQTSNALIRFAANIPDTAKRGLAEQGDMFAQFSTIKTVFGSLDLTRELSLLLDTKLRTGSSDEASKLQTSLAALVGLGKMFLGGNNDPAIQALTQVIDLVKINAQDTDVALSLMIPKSVFDQFAEAEKKKEKK